MKVRYVVLHHTGYPGQPDHYDLMIEREGALATWRVADPDLDDGNAERMADHRPVYLEFEGEISGGRGRVRRIREGRVGVLAWTGSEIRLEFQGWELLLKPPETEPKAGLWRMEKRRR